MANYSCAFLVIFTALCAANLQYSEAKSLHERLLLKDLFENYDVDARPVEKVSDTLMVNLSVSYKQLVELDEPKQTMKSITWVRIFWKDVNLQWEPSEYGNHSKIHVDPTRIWVPDLTLYNNVDERGGDLYNFENKITVTSAGVVSWFAPVVMETVCLLDISEFPFDTQKCDFKIGSWVYDGHDIELRPQTGKEPDIGIYVENTEWELVSAEAKQNKKVYKCCVAPFYDITYTLNFERKHLYYITTVLLPCVVLCLLATISFIFPPDSGERTSLVISVLLGLVVFMLIINDKTPVNSDTVPLISQFFNGIGFLIFLALLATAFVLRLNHASDGTPVSGYLLRFRNFIAFILCIQKNTCQKSTQLDFGEVLMASAAEHTLNLREHPIALPGLQERKRGSDEKILRELQKFSKYVEEQEYANSVLEDWKYTGRVFDKFFLLFFFLTFTAISAYFISAM